MSREQIFTGDFTRKEFREKLADGTLQGAIVPTATTEQHLEHLEMFHDSASVIHIATQVARKLSPSVVVATPVTVGVSEHHMAHPGTLTVRVGTFLDYVFDIVESLARAGIQNILVLNGHGGHMHPLHLEAVRMRQLIRANIVCCSYWDIYTQEQVDELMEHRRLPGHAQEYETSFALAAFPERVRTEEISGEAAAATAEKGEKAIAIAVDGVAALMKRMLAGETPETQPHSFRPDGTLVGPDHFPYQAPRRT